ncbi:protein-L-isoaspartate(D-aspartate) O-methyltransferase [Imhoffiella purpurea]|uniref:Protein-L-isoaspartate O-methyltransferase n=1 Tax=Imhoffiella purpurea TaxID=1249627 RepID=W9V961_9GAMM|nr:protein-L-isoaspartate(D-aspartate) O-methyltransferase [Imhoffiella purpurea]EXJ13396.1 Protein-L-isoaspartate O-methyltransferase [Imhoffiella purpurea]
MNAQHDRLVQLVEEEVRSTAAYLGIERLRPEVLEALRAVPRELFVPEIKRGLAYADHPLPIGCGQTISQPYIVAVMSDLLGVEAGGRVLELGTGSGYQAAILAAMGVEVYSLEIIPELAERASATLEELGYGERVHIRVGDGWNGWPEAAPFEGIIVTAAAPGIPRPLADQLAPCGRLLIPVGEARGIQQLQLQTRMPDGGLSGCTLLPVRFVPVTGDLGQTLEPGR